MEPSQEELVAEARRRGILPSNWTHVPQSRGPTTPGYNDDEVNIPRIPTPHASLEGVAKTAGGAVTDAANTVSLGSYGGLLGLQDRAVSAVTGTPGGSEAEMRRYGQEHPDLANWTRTAAMMAPGTPLARLGGLAAETVETAAKPVADALTGLLRRRASARAALALTKAGATGALTNVGAAATRNAVTGEQAPLGDAAVEGAGLGAGFGAVAHGAGAGADAMKAASPDLQLLENHGLTPRGPLPGPAVRPMEGAHPPEVPSRVTPATRAQAGLQAAEQVVPAIKATEQANNREFGRRSDALASGEGQDLGSVTPLLMHIDEAAKAPALPDASRAALGKLRDRVLAHIVDVRGGQMLMKASDINAMREYAQSLAGELKTAKVEKGDLPLAGAASVARDLLTQGVQRPMVGPLKQARPVVPLSALPNVPGLSEPGDVNPHGLTQGRPTPEPLNAPQRPQRIQPLAPGIADLNAQYAKTAEGVKRRYRLLGIPSPGTEPTEKTLEQAGRMITSRGEESKASGGKTGDKGHRIDRLEAMGAQPPTLPGTTVPEFPAANNLMDRPTVLGAVERMQLTPPQAFNAAKSPSMLANLATAAPNRTLYPALRAASSISPGRLTVPSDQLVHMIANRRKRGQEARE